MPESIDASLVRIRTKAGGVVGAGFLVDTRHILTCAHVIAQALDIADDSPDTPASTVSLDFPQLASHTLLTARVVFWEPVQSDGQGDIAGLELLDEPPTGAAAVHFTPADQVWEHPFRALGFPSGYDDGIWATGRLLGRQGTRWIQIEGVEVPGFAVIAGFSGAPVWDTQAQGVVGMVVASGQQAAAKAAFVIPADVLKAEWPQLESLMRPSVPRNPYKGLLAFTEHDARDFFGRDTLIDELATAVETALTREHKDGQQARLLTVVLGPSGSGKSSVVMAGLLPCLRAGRVLNSKEWVYLDPIFPGAHPLEALAVSLAKQLPARGPISLHEDLKAPSERNLHLLASQIASSPQQRVVLMVDQFEEMFTLTIDEAERRHFFDLLVSAVTEPSGPLFAILTLRADFYDRPMHYSELFRLIDAYHVSVLPLERDDLRKVIEQPANLPDVQVTFENGLVDELLMDMQGQSGALPLLEFTLDQLFQRRNGYQLTLQAYRDMGGVNGALSRHAEDTYQALPSDEHRQAARDIFLRLINPGETEQDTTRRRADQSEFERADSVQAQQMRETLEAFIQARLLTTNQVGGKITVEVSHEALIRKWKRLADWLREARDDILFQRSLSEDVEAWEQHKRPRDRLYRGAQLKDAQKWAARNMASEQEAAFLHASTTQRTMWFVGILLGALLLISSMGIAGWYVFLQPKPTLVTTLQDSGVGSLRWCIDNAPSGSTIRFAQNISRGIIELNGGDLVFAGDKTLTIIGPGTNLLTITNGNSYAVIHVSRGATLNVSGLSFKNSVTIIHAFLFNEGTLALDKSTISDNKTGAGATSYGGGIFNRGILNVSNSIISNNSSFGDQGGQGGGIDNEGKLTVTNSIISNNSANSSASSFGGGIYNYTTGILTVSNSTFSNNSLSGNNGGQGGGIANEGKLTVTHSTFSNNSTNSSSASSFGGGIYNSTAGTLSVISSTFSDNSANGQLDAVGGGIVNLGKLTMINSTFSGNAARGKHIAGGGGIGNYGKLTAINSTFSDNIAEGKQGSLGGGIFYYGSKDSSANISFSTIYGNTSSAGGGILDAPNGSNNMMISSSIIAANSASTSPDIGGAVISGGYNLIENTAGLTGLNTSTDKQVAFVDFKIAPALENNGGPTQTIALLQGSPAIDAVPRQACSITFTDASGQNVTITTDQRGDPRPDASESACDIGPYESSY
ncbi:MAG TPA: serine protease [Ktedonobacteraceae bacterium]|nr:serine protease [Ktedonobacteraceae bacterium]